MRILIVTDAWTPQTNGVVQTLRHTAAWLRCFGHEVVVLGPGEGPSLACPGYPEIRLSLAPVRQVREQFERFAPEALHLATEGPLGLAARHLALARGIGFTTSFHTQFPQYLRRRAPVPESLTWAGLRWFHGAAGRCMVSTPSVEAQLRERGFTRLVRWRRGVDTTLFRPRPRRWLDLPRPLAVYVGRVAVEKNVEAFLTMPWRGGKLLIGDGPELPRLRARHPGVHCTGCLHGEDLARHLAAADVMVFPSRTDTFGLVNLEALACGVPVAAFPVPGPIDVVQPGRTGVLDEDLGAAARAALDLDRRDCREFALSMDWQSCTREFEAQLVAAAACSPAGALASRTAHAHARAPHPEVPAGRADAPAAVPVRAGTGAGAGAALPPPGASRCGR